MKKTIIFLSGWLVPNFLARTKFLWDHSIWKDYNVVYYESKTPISDLMVQEELDRLAKLVRYYDKPYIVGHSLGGWWLTNLASRVKLEKLAYWTPLDAIENYPMFNVSSRFYPLQPHKLVNFPLKGKNKIFVAAANQDLIVPTPINGYYIYSKLDGSYYQLDGGHYYQNNHKAGLLAMKEWLEEK